MSFPRIPFLQYNIIVIFVFKILNLDNFLIAMHKRVKFINDQKSFLLKLDFKRKSSPVNFLSECSNTPESEYTEL